MYFASWCDTANDNIFVLYFSIPGPLQLTTPQELLLVVPSLLCQSPLHTHLARGENFAYPRRVNLHVQQVHAQ